MLKHPFLKTYDFRGFQEVKILHWLADWHNLQLKSSVQRQEKTISLSPFGLPYGVQADEDDAQRALTFIKPDVSLAVNIKEAVDGQVAELAKAGVTVSDFNKGNIKARQRMITQYAVAGENSGAVIGTDHAAENLTGFFTKIW